MHVTPKAGTPCSPHMASPPLPSGLGETEVLILTTAPKQGLVHWVALFEAADSWGTFFPAPLTIQWQQ